MIAQHQDEMIELQAALERLEAADVDAGAAWTALLRRLQQHSIFSVARLTIETSLNEFLPRAEQRHENVEVPREFWRSLSVTDRVSTLGDITSECLKRSPDSIAGLENYQVEVFGVRLSVRDLRTEFPGRWQDEKATPPQSSHGGRPTAAWRDAFTIELAVYINDNGCPAGRDTEGAGEIVAVLLQRLSDLGYSSPDRKSLLPAVKGVLRRLRV